VVFVDGSVRHFIVDGLARTAPRVRVAIAPEEIRRLRERKSNDELEVLKCANEVRSPSSLSLVFSRQVWYGVGAF
jgi:hypothetical protein